MNAVLPAHLMGLALQKIAFLPFGYIMDKYWFSLFRNQIDREHELNKIYYFFWLDLIDTEKQELRTEDWFVFDIEYSSVCFSMDIYEFLVKFGRLCNLSVINQDHLDSYRVKTT